jgi:hypothetical protein
VTPPSGDNTYAPGTDAATSQQQADSGASTFLPPFQIGKGLPGVFTDAVSLIAGGTVTANPLDASVDSGTVAGGDLSGTPGSTATNQNGIPGLGGFSTQPNNSSLAGPGLNAAGQDPNLQYGPGGLVQKLNTSGLTPEQAYQRGLGL